MTKNKNETETLTWCDQKIGRNPGGWQNKDLRQTLLEPKKKSLIILWDKQTMPPVFKVSNINLGDVIPLVSQTSPTRLEDVDKLRKVGYELNIKEVQSESKLLVPATPSYSQ